MSDGSQVVLSFLAAWSDRDARKLADYFTEDAVMWNDGRTTQRGRDAIREHLEMQLSAVTDCNFETTALAVSGNVVFTERIDRMNVVGAPIELPVAGVFELNDEGKLTAWRDYFDLNTVIEQLRAGGIGGEPNA